MSRRFFLLVVRIIGIFLALAALTACGSPTKPPVGSFKSVSAAGNYACGLRSDNTIVCWGQGSRSNWESTPNGSFRSVDADEGRGCGIRQDGSIACWWFRAKDLSAGILPPQGSFKRAVPLNAGLYYALRSDGAVVGWVDYLFGPTPPIILEIGRFKSISRGRLINRMCGVRIDDSVGCWGDELNGNFSPPGGKFISVSISGSYACGIRVDNTVVCWGDREHRGTGAPPGHFTAVTTGAAHACGIRIDKSVECWGDNADGKTQAPSGSFMSISAHSLYTCAVRTNGTVVCWGK